jgi:3-oxoacyl-[acyl-carrier protein] reductase
VIGKNVVITGGEGDLAAAISREFQDAGYEVESPGRSRLDVSDSQSVCGFFQTHKADLLICTAGLAHDSLVARMATEDWSRVWQTNYLGAKQCAEAALPHMIQQGFGHILFLSSHSALHPPPGQAAYAASKRALLGLTQELATTCGASNIRINAILPGFLDNRMTSYVCETRKETVLQEHVLGRLNTMDRVASFIRFLHESMPHTSGQWFQLDNRPMRV